MLQNFERATTMCLQFFAIHLELSGCFIIERKQREVVVGDCKGIIDKASYFSFRLCYESLIQPDTPRLAEGVDTVPTLSAGIYNRLPTLREVVKNLLAPRM